MLKSIKSDTQGNFITTFHIPAEINTGANEFIIKNEYGDLQSTNVNISEQKNRFLRQDVNFEITDIPAGIRLGETLSISGNGQPSNSLILTKKTGDIIEKIRVIDINSNGKWTYEEVIHTDEIIGPKTYFLKIGS